MLQRLIFIVLLLFASSAYAHSPYLIKQGSITDPNGNPIIKEKLYGDGIFVSDPVTFQLRSGNGALLANSLMGDHVATFCPSINFCWAFPYSVISPLSAGWYLDMQAIEFNQPVPNYEFEGKGEEEFKSYLSDKNVKRFSGYFLGYPEDTQSHSGFKQSGISIIFSPFVIVADQFIQLFALLFLTLIPFALYWLLFKWKKIERKAVKYPVYLLGTLLIIGYLGFYCLAIFIMGFTLSTPWLYMLAFIITSIAFGKLFLRRKTAKKKEA